MKWKWITVSYSFSSDSQCAVPPMSQAQVVVQWSPAAQTRLLPSSSSLSLLSILLAPSLTDHFITTTAGLKTSSRCPGCRVVLLLAAAPPPHSDKSVLTLRLTETTQVTITHCVALTTLTHPPSGFSNTDCPWVKTESPGRAWPYQPDLTLLIECLNLWNSPLLPRFIKLYMSLPSLCLTILQ